MMRNFTPASSRRRQGARQADTLQRRRATPRAKAGRNGVAPQKYHRPVSLISQSRRPGRPSDREKRQPVQAHDRGDLREHEIVTKRHANLVPRKSGQHDRPQPFARAKSDRQREHVALGLATTTVLRSQSRRPGRTPGRRAAPGPRAAEPRRTDPGRPGRPRRATIIRRRNSRSPTTSRSRRPRASIDRPDRRPPLGAGAGRAVDQPDRHHHRRQRRRQEIEWRQGQGADRAGGKGNRAATPIPRQNHALREGAR